MVAQSRGRRQRAVRGFVAKPRGRLTERVQQVGPERFGIACVDCGKARSKWMVCDFYGRVLLPPAELPHVRGHFDLAIMLLQDTALRHGLRDQLVAIERTGNYHQGVRRAFAAAGFETRIVHPYATWQFRQVADPGNKTDDTDLAAIFRATVNGFGLSEAPWDDVSQHLQLLARHRRDLVLKRSALYCQVREHLEAVLPGYADQFEALWETSWALPLVRQFASPQAVRQAGVEGLQRWLKTLGLRALEKTLARVVA